MCSTRPRCKLPQLLFAFLWGIPLRGDWLEIAPHDTLVLGLLWRNAGKLWAPNGFYFDSQKVKNIFALFTSSTTSLLSNSNKSHGRECRRTNKRIVSCYSLVSASLLFLSRQRDDFIRKQQKRKAPRKTFAFSSSPSLSGAFCQQALTASWCLTKACPTHFFTSHVRHFYGTTMDLKLLINVTRKPSSFLD